VLCAGIALGIASALVACTAEEDNRGGIFGDRPSRPSSDAAVDAGRDAVDPLVDASTDATDARDDGG
jgi:hypothetical protein